MQRLASVHSRVGEVDSLLTQLLAVRAKLPKSGRDALVGAQSTLANARSSLNTAIAPVLCAGGAHDDELERVILRENIIGVIDATLRTIADTILRMECTEIVHVRDPRRGTVLKRVVVGDTCVRKIWEACAGAQRSALTPAYELITPDTCDTCGSTGMQLDADTSRYVCDVCGGTTDIDGIIFHENQVFAQSGTKTRANDYSAMRHFDDWMHKLLGEEKYEIQPHVVVKLKRKMLASGCTRADISCVRKMRELLKDPEVDETRLNDHATLLIVLCGGRAPYAPTPRERNIIHVKYRTIVSHYFDVVGDDCNVKYCPYFIYKIIECFFGDHPQMLGILRYIHLQSDKTLSATDRVYEQICERIPAADGFVYRATDRARFA